MYFAVMSHIKLFCFCFSQRILKDKEDLPAAKIQPTNGSLYWILDQDAAKFIKSESD